MQGELSVTLSGVQPNAMTSTHGRPFPKYCGPDQMFVPFNCAPCAAEIVVGFVPVNVTPVPAMNEPDPAATHDVRLPLLSKQAPMLAREDSAGSSASVSP